MTSAVEWLKTLVHDGSRRLSFNSRPTTRLEREQKWVWPTQINNNNKLFVVAGMMCACVQSCRRQNATERALFERTNPLLREPPSIISIFAAPFAVHYTYKNNSTHAGDMETFLNTPDPCIVIAHWLGKKLPVCLRFLWKRIQLFARCTTTQLPVWNP